MNNFVEDLLTKNYFDNVEKIPLTLGIERKALGAYYTDRHIVEYILDSLDINQESYVLDPSCGCGSFILPLYSRNPGNISVNLNKIYGVDIDKKAIDFTVETILKISGKLQKNEILNHFINDDFIFESPIKMENYDEFINIIYSGGFHFIIGNPPFNLNIKRNKLPTLSNKNHLDIAKKSKNIPIYFILKGLEILRKNGVLAFVLPKTLLYVGRYNEFRSYLLNNFTVLKIVEIGIKFKGVRGEQMILFIKNRKPRKNSSIEFSNISIQPPYQSENTFRVRQAYFTSMKALPTMESNNVHLIIKEINEKHLKLIDTSKISVFRGVSLGKTSLKTIPYPTNGDIPSNAFISGKCISKLSLRSLIIADSYNTSQPRVSKLRKPKIVSQNIYSSESGLISYLDMQGIPTAETVSNIFMEDMEQLAYVFALLNSKLMNFYLSQFTFSGSKLTMHMDGYYLRQLPLIWDPEREETSDLIKLGLNISNSETKDYKLHLENIDRLVYSLYEIRDDQRKVIEAVMRKTLSKKSIW